MITITIHCPPCKSNALVRNGRAPNGKQKYLCRACHRQSREDPTPHAYSDERWNNTLRQRLARFVRKTHSFSTSPVMHEACLDHFLHRYHLEQAITLF